MQMTHNFSAICRMIKIEHSIFALPFAYAGAFLAADGWPGLTLLFLLTVAMVGIRSFSMAFNRVADLPYDRKNPRSAKWPLVTGEITIWQTWRFAGVMAVFFVVACGAINPMLLSLSPIALVLCALYSYTKRLTWLCHFMLGLVTSLAPMGGWLAVDPTFSLPPFLLALGVIFWIAGFDILYSCQDLTFDIQEGLHSIPARFGLQGALPIAAFSHVNTIIFFLLVGATCQLSHSWYIFLAVATAILWWEHRMVGPENIARVRLAFSLNGPVSVILFLGVLLGVSYA